MYTKMGIVIGGNERIVGMCKMYQNYCKKCGSISLHTEVKGNNTGLYCDDCGAWIKWLSKDELRAFEHSIKKNSKCNENDVALITKFNDFVEYLDKLIDLEMDKMPLSPEDAIRKSSYCLALERSKNSILNILAGREYWDGIKG